jgi:hypothetical protein
VAPVLPVSSDLSKKHFTKMNPGLPTKYVAVLFTTTLCAIVTVGSPPQFATK